MGMIARIAADILNSSPPVEVEGDGGSGPHEGVTVRYTVEFRDHGTDHMSAFLTKAGGADGGESMQTTDHSMASDLLSAIVDFESNARAAQGQRPEEARRGIPAEAVL